MYQINKYESNTLLLAFQNVLWFHPYAQMKLINFEIIQFPMLSKEIGEISVVI